MNTNELLKRIKEHDFEAYNQLFNKYGLNLYNELRDRYDDRETADAFFNETMSMFYKVLSEEESTDALELMLKSYARGIAAQKECALKCGGADNIQKSVEKALPDEAEVQPDTAEVYTEPEALSDAEEKPKAEEIIAEPTSGEEAFEETVLEETAEEEEADAFIPMTLEDTSEEILIPDICEETAEKEEIQFPEPEDKAHIEEPNSLTNNLNSILNTLYSFEEKLKDESKQIPSEEEANENDTEANLEEISEVISETAVEEAPKGRFGFVLSIILLSLGIAAVLWIIAGVLMDVNIIPEIDLGYDWFNANIADWF